MARVHDAAALAATLPSDRAPVRALSPEMQLDVAHVPALGDLLRLGFVTQLCLAASDVEQALQLACRFSPLWSRCSFHYERGEAQVQVRARDVERMQGEGTFDPVDAAVTWSRLVDRLSGGSATPRAVEAPIQHRARLSRLLACPILDTESELAVCFASEDVARKNPQFDSVLVRVLAAHGEQRLAALAQPQSTRARVREALGQRTANGAAARVEPVARELGLSVRTLHRRLRAEGTSFRELLAEHKLERSLWQLELASTSAKQVAFELGFADPASFHRAFKRWTGGTVGQYRESNAQEQGMESR